jgi:uncharacterized protein YodC (DUF2158 family)
MPRKRPRQLKAGDVVRLRTGGPDMTVEEISETGGGTVYRCCWFTENGALHHSTFSAHSLVPAQAEEKAHAGGENELVRS